MTQIKKIIILKYHLLLLYATTNHLSVFYITISNQFHGWIEKKLQSISQSRTCIQNMWWSLFGGPLWIRAKPLYLRSMLSKSMRCTENCNTCSQHWSTEWAQFFSMTMPDWTSHNQRFKSWTTWAVKFCLIHHIYLTSRQPTITSSSISTTFYRQNASTTSRKQKMLSKITLNPGINQLQE